MTDGAPARRVAWVTGASRGVGRGMAVALGQAGWVVYVSARSSADGRTGHLPGTVEQTAGAVTAAGGLGVAAGCYHRDDAAVPPLPPPLPPPPPPPHPPVNHPRPPPPPP